MSLKEQIQKDMVNVFMNSDEFAESIMYSPADSTDREINAIVNRERLKPDPLSDNRKLSRQAEIYIANDPDSGVSKVIKGQDKVSFPVYEGDTESVDWVVVDVLEQDLSGWKLLVQR